MHYEGVDIILAADLEFMKPFDSSFGHTLGKSGIVDGKVSG